jgi:alanine-synthesizing transaminase
MRAEGREPIDLTESNPWRCELSYPTEAIQRALAAGADGYAPEALGLGEARRAVCRYVADHGARVDERQVVITSSTSEAYAFLFKLLCEPGDDVLVPAPSYPLFEYLTGLESVEGRSYPLAFDGGWHLEPGAVADVAGRRTRAVLLMSPGNPTGAFLKRAELAGLQTLCAENEWALICDEVFADYGHGADGERVRTVLAHEASALTFAVSGLSKVAGLPQHKLAWLVSAGPQALVDEAMGRLELISDTFLSVGTPVQRALPELLGLAPGLQRQIRERVQENRARLLAVRPADAPWSILPAEGGWYAVLRVGREPGEEERCLALLEAGVHVHPGYFFDFPTPGFLVVSLLPPPDAFARGAKALAEGLAR